MTLITAPVSAGDTAMASQYNNARKDIIQNAGDVAATAGSANAYTLTLDAAFALTSNVTKIRFKASFTNTGAATINITPSGGAAIGAKTIKKFGSAGVSDVAAGDIQNNCFYEATYDGTNFVLTSPVAGTGNQKVTLYTFGAAIDGTTTPQAVYVSDGTNSNTAGRIYLADADDSTNEARSFAGFVTDNVSSAAVGAVRTGVVGGFTGLTVGSYYWVTNTAGGFSTTPGTAEICVGKAISTTQIDTDQRLTGWMFISSTTGIAAPAKSGGTGNTTSPGIARFAVITDSSNKASVTIAKIGVTVAGDANGPSNATNDTVGFSASWSGNTITITNLSLSGTTGNIGTLSVFYYR